MLRPSKYKIKLLLQNIQYRSRTSFFFERRRTYQNKHGHERSFKFKFSQESSFTFNPFQEISFSFKNIHVNGRS
jgi:hypothetical protein